MRYLYRGPIQFLTNVTKMCTKSILIQHDQTRGNSNYFATSYKACFQRIVSTIRLLDSNLLDTYGLFYIYFADHILLYSNSIAIS
jgi:hypothetical protein